MPAPERSAVRYRSIVLAFLVVLSVITFMDRLAIAVAGPRIQRELGISVELIDVQTLLPFDIHQIIRESVKKTNRIVVAEESHPVCSVNAEISAQVMEKAFDYLDAPVKRVSGADVPMPYAKNLEQLAVPDVNQIIAAVKEVAYIE